MRRLLLMAVLGILVGCSGGTAPSMPLPTGQPTSGKPAAGATFTEAVVGTPGFLNPLFSDEDNSREIDTLIYQGLVRVGADQQVHPLLAKELQLSDDHLTYTAHLRDDVRWADGAAFGVDDVLFTFGVLQDPAYDRPAASVWKGLTVKKVGDADVAFTLRSPSAGFPLSLLTGILPKHLFSGDVAAMPGSPFSGRRALGTGPFMVDSISADRSEVVLRRNPHATPAPWLDRIVFRSYASLALAVHAAAGGEADAVGGMQSPAFLKELQGGSLAISDVRTFSFTSVFLNISNDIGYFVAPAVRRALAQAVDRRRVVADALGGRADPVSGPIPPSDWAYSHEAGGIDYNSAAAAKSLTEAGWTLPDQGLYRTRAGHDFTVTLVAADAYPFREVADSVRRQLQAVGVRVTVQDVPVSQLVTRYLVGRGYQMAIASFDNGPDPDQFSLWHSSMKQYPLNVSGLPRQGFIDKALEEGRARTDTAGRMAAYADLQKLISEASPAIFLYEPHYQYAVSRRVHGLHMNPVIEPGDRFEYVTDWYVATK